jgi:hypothetical protein
MPMTGWSCGQVRYHGHDEMTLGGDDNEYRSEFDVENQSDDRL